MQRQALSQNASQKTECRATFNPQTAANIRTQNTTQHEALRSMLES